MPVLPSGRQIELAIDRFMAYMPSMDLASATQLFHSLQQPDDLLYITDVIYFDGQEAAPQFADFVAADWEAHSGDWSEADRTAFKAWLASTEASRGRAEMLGIVKEAMQSTEFPV